MQQSLAILDLCLRKTQTRKSHGNRNVFVFEKIRFQMYFVSTKTESRRFQERFQKLGFRDGLVWIVGLTVEIKLCFKFLAVWTRSKAKSFWFVSLDCNLGTKELFSTNKTLCSMFTYELSSIRTFTRSLRSLVCFLVLPNS